MQLRTRITVTFQLLLAAVLVAALGAVLMANRRNAAREVDHQLDTGTLVFRRALESNRRQLTQASEAVAADYGFRAAVATHDTETLASALENTAARINASLAVLTTLDGKVIASFGLQRTSNAASFESRILPVKSAADETMAVIVDAGRVYQLVAVSVRSPLPVARIYMGFELDTAAMKELADITGLAAKLSVESRRSPSNSIPRAESAGAASSDIATRRIVLAEGRESTVVATLSRSLADARAPFEPLTHVLFLIAAVSLLASAITTYWLARNITQPLRNLTSTVDKIRAGSYDISIAVERRDELGLLAEGLQVMQSAVQSRDRAISMLAYEDALTGLKSRLGFAAALTETLSRTSGQVAVAVINLRRFRRINELLGFAVGDAVLVEIAARLRAQSGAVIVGRLAADEFAACLPIEAGSSLQAWGTTFLALLQDPIIVEAQPIDISATIGLTMGPDDATQAEELLRCADLAMERARREKRLLAIYEPSLQLKSREQLSLLGELRRAVDQDELRLYYQPQMELATGRVAGAEVLLRWQHPTRDLVLPAQFIPFAEQTGFIRQLTRWTLEHAVAQGAQWYRDGRALALAVNVSADDLTDERFDQRVSNALARHGLPPALLTLEITESGFIEDPVQALHMLDRLASLGVNLSIDDFGTGYSSLNYLARMPVHEVKIDRSFIQELQSDPELASVVRSAIDMGHNLGLKVVAEGIEGIASAERLRHMGCDVGQGYLYAKPMPSHALEAWLVGRTRVPITAVPANLTLDDIESTLTIPTFKAEAAATR